jgi:hypothetical protein
MGNLIKIRVLTSIIFLLFHLSMVAQKKNKKYFKDGYIIRFSDTISCKIFAGFESDEIGYEVTFHYGDGRLITYHPGSVIKGFGIYNSSGTVHYYQVSVPEYWINEQTNNKAYAEVVSNGQLTLYKFTKVKNSTILAPIIVGPVIGAIVSDKEINSFFLKVAGEDSIRVFKHKNAFGKEYFERESVLQLVKDRPQVLANTPPDKFVYVDELKTILNDYNSWYRKFKEQELKNNSEQCP